MSAPRYTALKDYYEDCLATHGATPKGVDWPDAADLETRFQVMADMFQPQDTPYRILDVGCGPGFFLDYLIKRFGLGAIEYHGVDISPQMIASARQRHPGACFDTVDLIAEPPAPQSYDYAVFNGVFTVRDELSFEEMRQFCQNLLSAVFPACRTGLAVNFMAPHADWQDEKLFYLPFETAAETFKAHLTRHFAFRSDYGLWEYTAYVRQAPVEGPV